MEGGKSIGLWQHANGEEWETRGHACCIPPLHIPPTQPLQNGQLCYCYVDLGEAFSRELFDVPAATSLFKPVSSVIACISHIKTPCITCMTQIWHTPPGISARLDPNTFSCLASRLFCGRHELFRKWLWWKREGIIRMRGRNFTHSSGGAIVLRCRFVFSGSRWTRGRLWGLRPSQKRKRKRKRGSTLRPL